MATISKTQTFLDWGKENKISELRVMSNVTETEKFFTTKEVCSEEQGYQCITGRIAQSIEEVKNNKEEYDGNRFLVSWFVPTSGEPSWILHHVNDNDPKPMPTGLF